jgi:hypothetical protein
MIFGGGSPIPEACRPDGWWILAALALLFVCCQEQPPPPPIEEPTPIEVETRSDGGLFAYYRIWVEQDGSRWTATLATKDTSLLLQFLEADSARIGVEACNPYGQSRGIVWGDVWQIQPDTLQYPLEATEGTSYNWITIPQGIHPMPARASDLCAAIHLSTIPPTPCWTVSEWNATAQTFTHYTTKPIPTGDFNVYPGRAYRIEIAGSCIWRPTVRRATNQGWCWRPSEDDTGDLK